jgi:hypothetical protein
VNGAVMVQVPASSAAQLVMGLAMAAVGQLIREAYGELPASAGQPLDALCELGSALRDAADPQTPMAETSLQTLTVAHRALDTAAQEVADGTVPVVILEQGRPQFAKLAPDRPGAEIKG